MQRTASDRWRSEIAVRGDTTGSAEKGRSYVADEEIRLIFLLGVGQ